MNMMLIAFVLTLSTTVIADVHVRCKTWIEAKHQVFEYIEVRYNRKRLHSKLGYVSLETFEAKKVA